MNLLGLNYRSSLKPKEVKEFQILPKRWLLERTYGWFNWWRRLNKNYEVLPQTSETFIYKRSPDMVKEKYLTFFVL